ncbi:MAG: hypothetical protein V4597_05045 [Pseudomonadota bacterium]
MLPYLRPPIINMRALVGDDIAAARTVELGLMELGSLVRQMQADLALFDFAMSNLAAQEKDEVPDEVSIEWLGLAARDGASAVFKFAEDMAAITIAMNRCPMLLSLVDHTQRRAASKAFGTYFPDFAGIRHSGQHGAAELYGAGKGDKHLLQDGALFINNLFNRRLETSFLGRLVSYELDTRTLDRLGEVRDLYWKAFAKAALY